MTKAAKEIYCDSCGRPIKPLAATKEMKTKYGTRFFHDPPEECARA